jgi:hypothetical protein
MRFDDFGMSLAFDKLQEDAEKKGHELGEDSANFFLRLTKKMGWKAAPPKETIQALLGQYGGRLKRKPGVTPEKEIARRLRARGTFARRWYIQKVEKSRLNIKIWIANTVSYADAPKLAQVVVQAATVVGKSFQRRLTRTAEKIMQGFGK